MVVAKLNMREVEIRAAENDVRRRLDHAHRSFLNGLRELEGGEMPLPTQNRPPRPPHWQAPHGPEAANMNDVSCI
jgi:hypothetical protein